MSYSEHFKPADDYIHHTNEIVNEITDPFIKQRYIGFVVTAAVTAFELAIKDIFIGFSYKKHKVFGTYVEDIYSNLNGQIKLNDLESRHIKKFGDKYTKKFKKKLEEKEKEYLQLYNKSIKGSYGNIITWRHKFVHEGIIVSNANYCEAVQAFENGKEVIHVLSHTMYR